MNENDQGAVFPDGWVAVARSRPYRVDWCAPAATCREGSPLLEAPQAFTDADKAAFLALAQATAAWPPTANINETVGWPETIPAFIAPPDSEANALHTSPDGRLFVRRVPTSIAPANRYDIINRDGVIEAWMQLPINEQIVGFSETFVYIAATDAFGVQRLKRHPRP